METSEGRYGRGEIREQANEQFAGGSQPALRLLVLHDDGTREFDYTAGADAALARAKALGWTVISMRTDWARIFADEA